jgi:hypothetical protein
MGCMAGELIGIVREIFPKDSNLHKQAEPFDLAAYGGLATSVRKYPFTDQVNFFKRSIRGTLQNSSVFASNELALERGTEQAGQLAAEINQIPTKTNPLTEEEIQVLAESSLAACGVSDVSRLRIRIVRDLEETKELFTKVSNQEVQANGVALRKGIKGGHPLGVARGLKIRAEGSTYTPFRALGDGTNNYLAILVTKDLLIASGFNYTYGSYVDDQGRDLDNFSGHSPSYHLSYRIADSLGWEVLSSLDNSPKEQNPYRPYIEMMRPSQWPIGYDLETQEFLVAAP